MVKSVAWRIRLPRFKSCLCHLLAMYPCASHIPSLGFCFLICKGG